MSVKKLISVLMLSGFLAACAPENMKDADSSAGTMDQPTDGVQTGGLMGADATDGSFLSGLDVSFEKGAINDAHNVLIEKVIYFDYDSDQISADYQKLISYHGKYLAANSDMRLRLEGHADERGSREYNVALANRRAQSVRRMILFQGANANQVDVISYGEEKPVALAHDEESWRLNRRVELVYEAR